MPIDQVTVQQILYAGRKSPSGKIVPFDAIITAELGFISLQRGQVKNFQENHVYEVGYTEKGEYKNDGTFLKDLAKEISPPKQYTRAPTNPLDSDRMGTMGMVNPILNGIAYGRQLNEIIEYLKTHKGEVATLIDLLHDELHRTKMHGAQVQRRDDMDDEMPPL